MFTCCSLLVRKSLKGCLLLALVGLLFAATPVNRCVAQESDEPAAAAAADQSPSVETPQAPSAASSTNREPVPILPDANQTAWQREVWLIGMMFVMAIGCTGLAAAGFWMLSKNSSSDSNG